MDMVDTELFQRSGVTIVGLEKGMYSKRVMEYHIRFTILSQ
jgi:hypothetical protein